RSRVASPTLGKREHIHALHVQYGGDCGGIVGNALQYMVGRLRGLVIEAPGESYRGVEHKLYHRRPCSISCRIGTSSVWLLRNSLSRFTMSPRWSAAPRRIGTSLAIGLPCLVIVMCSPR